MSDTITKCIECESQLDEDYTYSNVKDAPLCYDCENEDLQSASTLVKVHGGEHEKVRIGDAVIYDDDAEIPDFFKETYTGDFKGRIFVKTDGWRGHYDTIKNLDKLTPLASGWTTGWADEYHQRKAHFNNFLNEIAEGEYATPYPIFVLSELTSNVFSQSVDFACFTKDVEAVTQWLEEIGHPVSLLKEQLS